MGSVYLWKTLDARVKTITELHISADYRLEMLQKLQNAVNAFNKGLITEEELLYIAA